MSDEEVFGELVEGEPDRSFGWPHAVVTIGFFVLVGFIVWVIAR